MDEKLLANIKKMADSSDWRVREDAAGEIKKINDNSFLEYLPIWKKWVKDPNPNIRRNYFNRLLYLETVLLATLIPYLFSRIDANSLS